MLDSTRCPHAGIVRETPSRNLQTPYIARRMSRESLRKFAWQGTLISSTASSSPIYFPDPLAWRFVTMTSFPLSNAAD
jgi:hypothetical protein